MPNDSPLAETAKSVAHTRLTAKLEIHLMAELRQLELDFIEDGHIGGLNGILLGADDERRIERLFLLTGEDRSKAYELKCELDRLGAFREYEDRFLDLFKNPD